MVKAHVTTRQGYVTAFLKSTQDSTAPIDDAHFTQISMVWSAMVMENVSKVSMNEANGLAFANAEMAGRARCVTSIMLPQQWQHPLHRHLSGKHRTASHRGLISQILVVTSFWAQMVTPKVVRVAKEMRATRAAWM